MPYNTPEFQTEVLVRRVALPLILNTGYTLDELKRNGCKPPTKLKTVHRAQQLAALEQKYGLGYTDMIGLFERVLGVSLLA